MYGLEAVALNDAFIDLSSNFNLRTVCAFLEACWLVPEPENFTTSTLERLIYTEGDPNEVFTRPEREIIKMNHGEIYYNHITLEASRRSVEGHLFAVELESTDTIYDSIAIMKLINKSIDGFNVFLFVSQQGVHIGCSTLAKDYRGHDCILSPAINANINWEFLYDILICRTDSSQLTEYYYGIVSICEGVKFCYTLSENTIEECYSQQDFNNSDYLEDIRYFNVNYYLNGRNYDKASGSSQIIDAFEDDVKVCMHDLSFIVKSHINPLELLFEAEQALLITEQQTQCEIAPSFSAVQEDEPADVDLLDDPIALMKKLKIERGI